MPKQQGLYDPSLEKGSCGVGFIAQINGQKSSAIVHQALELLKNLEHRGAEGADEKSGDGAGILCQIPHDFLVSVTHGIGIHLPAPGHYGVGMMFLPRDDFERRTVRNIVKQAVAEAGFNFLGWRSVPVDGETIGPLARSFQPRIRQFFVTHPHGPGPSETFERQLYLIRRRIEKMVEEACLHPSQSAYVLSLSANTLIYKGMLKPSQLDQFFLDLKSPLFCSSLALVHSRFSTNTFPSWSLAQPFRHLCHNGEINTLKGNRKWMRAREGRFTSSLLGESHAQTLPLLHPSESDSASLDRTLELLYQNGRSLAHAGLMLIPDPWENRQQLSPQEYDFYRHHSMLMEPWDGPAAVCFTNGRQIGAKLDRNGLRPLRYFRTKDGRVILSSEAGAVREDEDQISYKGRVAPGQILIVDTDKQKIFNDREIRTELAQMAPYGDWLKRSAVRLKEITTFDHKPGKATNRPAKHDTEDESQFEVDEFTRLQAAFGYTREEIESVILPMTRDGKEVVSSMGNDTPLAILSEQPQLLFNYFRQSFAQVTNPPIDPIRENQVMSLLSWIGPLPSLLSEGVATRIRVKCPSPLLSQDELESLLRWEHSDWKVHRLSLLYKAQDKESLTHALDDLIQKVDKMVADGVTCLVLSDRGLDAQHLPIPSLLAVSAVHQHLIRQKARSQIDLLIESAEPRTVHHVACLLGYGASGIVPYLVYETLRRELQLDSDSRDWHQALGRYRHAIDTGLLKIFSRMGISTAQSYKGAQIFEILGISRRVVDIHFSGSLSRLDGLGLREIQEESKRRHDLAYGARFNSIPAGNDIHYRPKGEQHSWRPEVIENLQVAVRTDSKTAFRKYSELLNEESKQPTNLRNLLRLRFVPTPLSLSKVESASSIVKCFTTGAMSLGALSEEVHQTLAKTMNRLGAKSNSGEGGEDPLRYQSSGQTENLNSAIKQVASGRFGVTAAYLRSAQEIQIKMAQGAKPGEGGQLPGDKVDRTIARLRHATPGVPLISPPPHHDIYSIEDLKQLIFDLRNLNPKAAISVKLVSQAGVGTVAAGVAKAYADKILISGDTGGTGAAPLSSIKHVGAPWEMGLAETHQTLVLNGMRDKVRLESDGQMRTGRDIAIACILGADEFGFSTAPLITQGCLMMRKCHLNTCPVGIATQDPILRERFKGSSEYLIRYFFFVAEEVRQIMAKMGFRSLKEMRGRVDRLDWDQNHQNWKIKTLDLSALLHRSQTVHSFPKRTNSRVAHPDKVLDRELISLTEKSLEQNEPISIRMNIKNTNLCIGTLLSGHLVEKYGASGLSADSICLLLKGSAGQSLGAFLIPGVSIQIEGEANDYAGKGLCGGKIAIFPPANSPLLPSESIIVGNTSLYGATSGEFYAYGLAGERFAVRNSGATAVIEGVGDHGCEYMTGGTVVILGPVGRNFAAGVSGGQIFVWDQSKTLLDNINPEMVTALPLHNDKQEQILRQMIEKHYSFTNSRRALEILENWEINLPLFFAVTWRGETMPQKKYSSTTPKLDISKQPPEVQHG
ncbi:MAG: glutamate synthase large subunit [Bdellovibrionales bacterium]|nr:glutamate synthase large subunit [Bdellovibrionales bacterium]